LDPADTPSFWLDIQPMLSGNGCANGMCHGPPLPILGLDLADRTWVALVGVDAAQCQEPRMRVEPGRPEQSYLIHKLTGERVCAGKSMPPSVPIDSPQVRMISDWICAGAIDDTPAAPR
jgi:hypothetical protein